MERAIREAKIAKRNGDYAIGAVVIRGNKIIAAGSSHSKRHENPIGHAEMLVIEKSSKILKRRHLSDCILYSTHEPCPMCAAAAVYAKMGGVVFGARIADMKNYRVKNGNEKYLWRTIEIPCAEIVRKSTEKIPIVKDFMRDECIELFHSV